MRLITQEESHRPMHEVGATADAFPKPGGLESSSPYEFLEDPVGPPALIAVMGLTGSGKTTFVNTASKSDLKVADDLNSCTSKIQESEEFILDGRRVVLIDTPGFDDSHTSDTDILNLIAAFLGESYSAGAKLAGVIYVHRISDFKFGNLAARKFRLFKELCGEKTLKNVILMTNMWGCVTPEQGDARERQLKNEHFKAAIEKGAQLRRHDNTVGSAQAILREILKNQPVVLRIQRELVDEGKDIEQTGAGAELNQGIREVVEKHQREIKELENEMRNTLEKNEEYRKELEEEKRKMEEEIEKLRKDTEEMQSGFEQARREMEERINTRFEGQMTRVQEGYATKIQEYEDRIAELERGEGDNTSNIKVLQKLVEELYDKMEESVQRKAGGWMKNCTIM